MNKDPKVENLVIVGGGAAGLAAAIYAARAEINPLVIEGMPPGGQLMLTSEVENYPGFPEGVAGTELIGKFRKQAEKFGTRFITDSISSVKVSGENSNRIITVSGPTLADVQTKTLLVATGADAMWLGLESEQRLRGKGVSACATCDGFFFRDKVVAVLGGGDTALEEATFITKFAQKVYIIHRRAEFRASKFMQSKALNNPKIEPIYNATVEEVLGEEKVTGVRLQLNSKPEARNTKQFQNPNVQNEKKGLENSSLENSDLFRNSKFEIRNLPLDGLFVAIGHKPATGFLKDSGVLLDRKGYIYTSGRVAYELQAKKEQNFGIDHNLYNYDYQFTTNVPGIFAAGDCVDHVYRQATTAVGMGVAAELEVEKWLLSLDIRQ